MNLEALARSVRRGEAIARKREIRLVTGALPGRDLKDDAAFFELGGARALIATDSIVASLCRALPRFAGWCAVAVTANDIWATGGRPRVATTVLGAENAAALRAMARGAAEAAAALGIEIIGGHVNPVGASPIATATVVGEAPGPLLPASGARSGDLLAAAVDLRGGWMRGWPGAWNSHRAKKPERLRADLDLLPSIAGEGLAAACKDISNAGALGTLAILLETSGVGGWIDLEAIPRPGRVAWEKWAAAFPSYGFLFAVTPAKSEKLLARFAERGIAAATVGVVTPDRRVWLEASGKRALLFDFRKERIL